MALPSLQDAAPDLRAYRRAKVASLLVKEALAVGDEEPQVTDLGPADGRVI